MVWSHKHRDENLFSTFRSVMELEVKVEGRLVGQRRPGVR